MKRYTPSYYPDFTCIGGSCTDNCCIGWEIDIDPKAYAAYLQTPGEIGQRLRQEIVQADTPYFRLGADGRCPFLNGENLCDLHIALGEDALCRICAMHPRFALQWGDRGELGIGLACPTAAALILSQPSPMELICTETEDLFEDHAEPFLAPALLAARYGMLELLQGALSFGGALKAMLLYAAGIQDAIAEGDDIALALAINTEPAALPRPLAYHPPEVTLAALREAFASLEYLDPAFGSALQEALALPSEAFTSCPPALEAPFRRLAEYLLFRHFLKAAWDGDALGRIQFTAVFCLAIRALCALQQARGGEVDFSCFCRQAQLLSKEIEYAEPNLDALLERFIDVPELDTLPLCCVLDLWDRSFLNSMFS